MSKFEEWAQTLRRVVEDEEHDSSWGHIYATHWKRGSYEIPSNRVVDLPLTSLSGTTDDQLYVFPQYEYLNNRIKYFRDSHSKRLASRPRALLPAVIIMGTPGIGKSCFLEFMAFLEIRLGHPFIMFSNGEFFVFSENGVYSTEELPSISKRHKEFRNILLLIDADTIEAPATLLAQTKMFIVQASSPRKSKYKWYEQRPGSHKEFRNILLLIDADTIEAPATLLAQTKMFIVQASSPRKSKYKWYEQRPGSVIFIMNPHDRESLQNALSLSTSGNKRYSEVSQVIASFGPNMRLIQIGLRNPQEATDELQAAIEGLEPQQIQDLVRTKGGFESTQVIISTSSRREQPAPGDISYVGSDSFRHTIANQLVWRLIYIESMLRRTQRIRSMIRRFMLLPQTAASAGWLFETWAHETISRGCTLKLIPMLQDRLNLCNRSANDVDVDVVSIEVQRLKPMLFASQLTVSSTTSYGTYYIPSAANNPTFDSFFRINDYGIGLQITTSGTHTLKSIGLGALQSRIRDCPKRLFVFVIPAGWKFTCAVPTRSHMEPFEFYTVEMNLGDAAPTGFFDRELTREEDDVGMPPDAALEDVAMVVDYYVCSGYL